MEMFILGLISGGISIAIFITLVTIDKMNSYEEENQALYQENKDLRYENEEQKEISLNAEKRAVTHFRKLQAIERILNQDKKTKEFAVFTVNKIKEVIQSPNVK